MNGPTDDVFVYDTNTVINHLKSDKITPYPGERVISVVTEMEACEQ
jgi:hypothetical protein